MKGDSGKCPPGRLITGGPAAREKGIARLSHLIRLWYVIRRVTPNTRAQTR